MRLFVNRLNTAVLSILLLSASQTSALAEGPRASSAVKRTAGAFFRALNESNIDTILELYHPDGVYLPKNAPAMRGVGEIKKAYQALFGRVKFNVDHVYQDVSVHGNIAIVESRANGTVTIRETKQTAPVDVKELFVFRKVDNKWKIDRYMFNDNTPTP
jgi:uncharacterized protein (TIGR02246 family)